MSYPPKWSLTDDSRFLQAAILNAVVMRRSWKMVLPHTHTRQRLRQVLHHSKGWHLSLRWCLNNVACIKVDPHVRFNCCCLPVTWDLASLRIRKMRALGIDAILEAEDFTTHQSEAAVIKPSTHCLDDNKLSSAPTWLYSVVWLHQKSWQLPCCGLGRSTGKYGQS